LLKIHTKNRRYEVKSDGRTAKQVICKYAYTS